MSIMAKHSSAVDLGGSAPVLPLWPGDRQERITVVADAMRGLVKFPGSASAQQRYDAAVRGSSPEEREEAWAAVEREQERAARPEPPAVPSPAAAGDKDAQRPADRTFLGEGQLILAVTAVVLELALAPVFFAVMFVTVNGMLAGSFRWWAWSVPISTEITFVLLLVLAILFEWMRRPVPVLWKLPYLFMGLSSFMNVWAGRGSVAGIAGHLAVTAAFFIPLAFAKTTVRKLIVTPAERARAQALADAQAHAGDVLRAAFGVFWRLRTPVLLRRQLRSGRLPAAVLAAVETCDAALWEPAVQAWITAAVTLPGKVGRTLRAAAAVASADSGQDKPADNQADNGPDSTSDKVADSRRDTRTDSLADKPRDNVPDISALSRRTSRAPRRGQRTAAPDPVAAMIKRRPKWDDEQIAEACSVSTKTVKRRRTALAQAAEARATA